MTTISIANQKGGVGKTTTAIALSTALTRRGKRVMVIDTDFPESDRYTGLRCHAFVTIKPVTLASVAMLLSQLNVIFQTTESLFHYLERLFTAVFVSDRRFGPVSSAYMQLIYR